MTARARPKNRVQTESDKTPASQTFTYPAPTMGLVTNAALGLGAGAVVLENFWATPQGIEPRGGLEAKCTVPTGVEEFFQHRASATFFVATSTAIYPFTTSSSGALTASVTGQTGSDYSTYETQTSGGSFLTVVNGVDKMQLFDGTTWTQITGVSVPAITGIDTAELSFVWGYRNRLLFIEKDTMKAWYLGVDSITGAATSLPLSSVFRKGGSLLMGGTWSSDSGDGIDDRCVFITTAGEVAIFTGNPADATWTKQGVYDLGQTLGIRGLVNIAGDLAIATLDGLIPISGMVQKDPGDLKSVSIADPITPTWQAAARSGASGFRVTKWPRGSMLICAPLDAVTESPEIYISNIENRAWAVITGWTVGDIEALGDNLYLGGTDGTIYQAWTGGADDGTPFVCRAQFPFNALGDTATEKTMGAVRGVWKTRSSIIPKISIAKDYTKVFPSAPAASVPTAGTEGVWDISDWDDAFWASDNSAYDIYAKWRGAAGYGFAFAPQVQLTSSAAAKIDAQLERIDVIYTQGGAVA